MYTYACIFRCACTYIDRYISLCACLHMALYIYMHMDVYMQAFATALKQGSNQGLLFIWFNEYKRIVTNDGEKSMTPILGLFGGMTAGCFSTLGNNPFDVVKVGI